MALCDDTKNYAKETFITMEQAEIRCEHFKKIHQKIQDAKKCPKCGKHTLQIELGSYEENTTDYVYCDNDEIPYIEDGEEYFNECDFTSDVTAQFEPISHWYDFDIVSSFACNIESEGLSQIEKQIGSSWFDFVEDDNKKLNN
jgi:ssDNA-binding Zn-finger/Zn-ribbon topoisomerase 1